MKIRLLYLVLLTGIFFILTPAAIADAATYYVAKTGSDTTNLCTQTQPCLTINHGITKLASGDTLYIRGGTYAESIQSTSGGNIPVGTSWANAPRIAGYPGETVILNRATDIIRLSHAYVKYVIFENLIIDGVNSTVSNGIQMTDVEFIRFIDVEVKNTGDSCVILNRNSHFNEFDRMNLHHCGNNDPVDDHGIYLQGSNNLFENSEVHNSATVGIHQYNSWSGSTSDNNTFRNNRVHDNGTIKSASGIMLSSGDNNVAYNNIVWNEGFGLTCFGENSPDGTKFFNNTVYNTSSAGMRTSSNCTNTEFRNNIVHNTGDTLDPGSGTVFSNNLCTSSGIGCNLTGNPQFVSPSTNNFHLQSGSPAINKGTPIALVTTDFDGVSRPQPVGGAYDIGAYEFVSGGGVPTSTPTPTPGVANTPTPTPAGGADITTGLISHWKFDGTTQDTAGTNHGTFNGGTPSYIAGKLGQALSFDHLDDEVDIPDYNPNGADFSVGGWMNMPANSSSDPEPIAGNSQHTPMLGYDGAGDRVWTYVQESAGTETITWTVPSPLEGTGWHHVMLVARDSTNQVEAYVDGVSLGSQTLTRSYTHTNGAFRKIGRDSGSTFNGSLDDVRLYNRALSGTDIQALYALGTPPTNTPTPTPQGPTACHSLDNTQSVPSGYAASYNPFTIQKELLLAAQCNASNTTVTLGNGNMGDPTNWDGRMWVWNQGYQLLNNTWQPTTYTCSGEQLAVTGGAWCRASATGTIDAQATAYLGYTCQWHAASGSYKCGCQDTACATPLWHVQQIQ